MNSSKRTVYQLNLSPSRGGAEVFTGFFSRALTEIGWDTELIVSPNARYWQQLDIGNGQLVPLVSENQLIASLPKHAILVIHSPTPEHLVQRLSKNTRILALAHQVIYNAKQPSYYKYADTLIPVSHHVIETLKRENYSNIYPAPLYGIGCVKEAGGGPISRGAAVDWDQRKLRDRILSTLNRVSQPVRGRVEYKKRPGLTLGVVSRIAEAKQFPELFSRIAQKIKVHPEVWVEIFGCAVGFRASTDLRRAVVPIKDRVRYWGFQKDVASVYKGIDYLITGLPERESFGLNVIEAQMCGTPVLAPRAPPFTETVLDRKSGYLYLDPREDGGRDFARILDQILKPEMRPNPLQQRQHLAQFEFPAFCHRVNLLMNAVSKGKALPDDNSH